MSEYEVTLRGTWERINTLPSDITMMRRLSGQIRRERLMSGVAQPVEFELWARQTPVMVGSHPARWGTFKAVVRVPDTFVGTMRRRAPARARAMLRWFLQDATCRPPVLSFDSADVRRIS